MVFAILQGRFTVVGSAEIPPSHGVEGLFESCKPTEPPLVRYDPLGEQLFRQRLWLELPLDGFSERFIFGNFPGGHENCGAQRLGFYGDERRCILIFASFHLLHYWTTKRKGHGCVPPVREQIAGPLGGALDTAPVLRVSLRS